MSALYQMTTFSKKEHIQLISWLFEQAAHLFMLHVWTQPAGKSHCRYFKHMNSNLQLCLCRLCCQQSGSSASACFVSPCWNNTTRTQVYGTTWCLDAEKKTLTRGQTAL